MKNHPFSFLFAVPLCVAACGGLSENPNELDPLAVIKGTLAVSDGSTAPSSVRVALVWRTDWQEQGSERFSVAEDLEVTPEFPASFQLTLRSPPPEGAIGDEDGLGQVAVGSVVAYEDKNGNGRLDLVDSTATSYVDAIVGANEDLLIVWLPDAPTGAFADELRDAEGDLPTAGYNLYRPRTPCAAESSGGSADPSPSGGSASDTCDSTGDWLPIDAAFALPITNDPQFSWLMCKSLDGGDAPDAPPTAGPTPADPDDGATPGDDTAIPEGPFPAPGTTGLACSPDGRSYVVETCDEPALCEQPSDCAGPLVRLPDGATPPAGWPCTVTP